MSDTALIGYCGVDCSSCSDYTAGKCPGCRQSEWPDGDPCKPVVCCQEKGVHFCGACREFPCDMMKDFYEESESHKKAFELMLSLRDNQ